MEFLTNIIDILLNVDKHLNDIITDYKVWAYFILFIIIFAETGFVVTPFLPGDPLLFAAGTLIAGGNTGLNIFLLAFLLCIAAITGNLVNYSLGAYFGPRVFRYNNKFLKLSYYYSTKSFFSKHGGKAVIFSRFFPVLRTYVPFVAGIIRMKFPKFLYYNISGGLLWIIGFLALGYLFGNIPAVKENFTWVILVISVATTLPPIIGALYNKYRKKHPKVI
ncbi:MAG TPA: VTT domain-containing protein [Cytophagales bacterium]|nr:VTT domain-containing protein [Cytophagales bacterium]